MTDWYERRNELQPDMVFTDYEGDIVKLDRRVPGDGTQWYAGVWANGSWTYDDHTVEPGDLVTKIKEEAVLSGEYVVGVENT